MPHLTYSINFLIQSLFESIVLIPTGCSLLGENTGKVFVGVKILSEYLISVIGVT